MAKLNQFFKTIQQEQSHENTETTEDVTHSEQGQPVQVTDVMPSIALSQLARPFRTASWRMFQNV